MIICSIIMIIIGIGLIISSMMIILYYIVLYYIIYYIMLYIILYYILYYIILYFIILYCIILYYNYNYNIPQIQQYLDLFGTSPQGARLLGNSSTAQHITSGRGSTARASLGALGTARRANVGQKKMRNYCSEILYNVEIIWIIWKLYGLYCGFIMDLLWKCYGLYGNII